MATIETMHDVARRIARKEINRRQANFTTVIGGNRAKARFDKMELLMADAICKRGGCGEKDAYVDAELETAKTTGYAVISPGKEGTFTSTHVNCVAYDHAQKTRAARSN